MARIVVVDDSKLMRMLLKEILESAGHEVECWEEAPEEDIPALVIASDPNLVITDYNMPGCDGATLVRTIRRSEPELPIVMLTATHDPEVMAELKRHNPIRIIHKPLKPEELLEVLKELL